MSTRDRPDNSRVAAAIERELKLRKQTSAQAAREIGCGTSLISRWRRGMSKVSPKWVPSVAQWMGRPASEVMALVGYPSDADQPSGLNVHDNRLDLVADQLEEVLELVGRGRIPKDPLFQEVATAWTRLSSKQKEAVCNLLRSMGNVLD